MDNNEQYFNLISNISIDNASIFEKFIKLHEQAEACQVKQIEKSDPLKQFLKAHKDFINLIPEILQSYVLYVVKNEFKNDVGAYRASVPMFEKLFTQEYAGLQTGS
ncbi:hypothetical protein [Ottowia sp.]|uniref:hypothetical protein n=1 Tax=Ottowia sp. TaxID=1898956 RepID=UPI003A8929F1